MTLSKLIDRLDKSIVRGDLPRAFRDQLSSLREQTEAADAGFQELEARIKELEARIEARIKEREVQIKRRERVCRSSAESKANSRKQRSLKQIVHSVFGAGRRRSDWRG
jgi:flagellar motility protein MotE (MotC chaperone)